jgi:hypothetical protein
LLADKEPVAAVGSIMNPSGVAAQRDIVGKLIDLISKRKLLTFPRRQV